MRSTTRPELDVELHLIGVLIGMTYTCNYESFVHIELHYMSQDTYQLATDGTIIMHCDTRDCSLLAIHDSHK